MQSAIVWSRNPPAAGSAPIAPVARGAQQGEPSIGFQGGELCQAYGVKTPTGIASSANRVAVALGVLGVANRLMRQGLRC